MVSQPGCVDKPAKSLKTMFKSSQQSKPLARFDLFVRLKADQVQRFPNNSLTWCYRGDKFTTIDDEMLPKLVRMLVKHHSIYQVAIIRDNSKPASDQSRHVVMYCNGMVEENRLNLYSYMLTKTILPEWLK